MNIQWYPGHMAKAKRKITEELKLVDIVIELLDARIPMSSRNPEVNEIVGNKKRIIVLNKSDLADPSVNAKWLDYFNRENTRAILVNSLKGNGLKDVCLLYTSDAADDLLCVDLGGRRIIKKKIKSDIMILNYRPIST